MILNKNNWFAIYYNWIYGEYPEDICSFFWGSVMAIILAPFILPGKFIMSKTDEDYSWNEHKYGLQAVLGFGVMLLYSAISGVGVLVLDGFGYEFINLFATFTGGFALGVITLTLVALLIWGIYTLLNRTKSILPETHVIDNTADFIAGIKGKYCTRITWTDSITTITEE